MDNKSTYGNEFKTEDYVKLANFNSNKIKEAKLNPETNSNFNAETPFQKITTYSNNFIGHHGDNQYVKRIEKLFVPSLPFKGKSTYQKEYA